MTKGTDLIFPLKDIRVRGDLAESMELYENNVILINRRMQNLRKEFGTVTYSPKDKLLLNIWAAGKHQPNTSIQLRWIFKTSLKTITVASPLACILYKGTSKNSQRLLIEVKKLSKLPYYAKFIEFESERIKINAMAKANPKILEALYDIKNNAFSVEANLQQVLSR